ncbi:MAG: hypothetical protein IKO21_09140 [Fibrobacter sp.]|nr:hypothetical protein [Fibrobacter sp.]
MTISSKLAVGVISLALLAGFSFAQDDVIAQYGAITIKKVEVDVHGNKEENLVAVIDDSSDETPVITEDVTVDSVTYNRVFKAGVPSTLMLPFEVDTWQLGISAFEFVEVKKDCDPQCKYRVNVRTIYPQKIKANTPYVAISEGKNSTIAFNKRYQTNGYVLNTTVNDRKYNYSIDDIDWTFQGTYERTEFKDPKGVYGFAAKDKNDVKMGDFKKAACNDTSCAFIRPFRAYLKCSMASSAEPQSRPVMSRPAAEGEIASLDDLPESIEVHVLDDEEGGTTYLGRINTTTGEFVNEDNRWFDMKGRMLDRKPTTKGTYYYNRKKVIIK